MLSALSGLLICPSLSCRLIRFALLALALFAFVTCLALFGFPSTFLRSQQSIEDRIVDDAVVDVGSLKGLNTASSAIPFYF